MDSTATSSEVIRKSFPWQTFGINWRQKRSRLQLAVGSFIEKYRNQICILDFDEDTGCMTDVVTLEHPYPASKIIWMPDLNEQYEAELIATTGDFLRIWSVAPGKLTQQCVLNNSKSRDLSPPVTSFDWCEANPKYIVASSVDTTCTVWDLEVGVASFEIKYGVNLQLEAHDQEVYDVAFQPGSEKLFASVSGDKSLRLFDRSDLKRSRILYKDPNPLLRCCWNQEGDNNLISVFGMEDQAAKILDLRYTKTPVVVLGGKEGHTKCLNSMAWAPNSACHIITAADDCQALIWDISAETSSVAIEPVLKYSAQSTINQVMWSKVNPEWVAISCANTVEILRV
eukprot:m.85137 g.85137  ORF g.85137 m.85137 type:complete len:341 (+) comp12997_c0_seq4:143-1165(+)